MTDEERAQHAADTINTARETAERLRDFQIGERDDFDATQREIDARIRERKETAPPPDIKQYIEERIATAILCERQKLKQLADDVAGALEELAADVDELRAMVADRPASSDAVLAEIGKLRGDLSDKIDALGAVLGKATSSPAEIAERIARKAGQLKVA